MEVAYKMVRFSRFSEDKEEDLEMLMYNSISERNKIMTVTIARL